MTTGQDVNARIREMWSAVDYNPIATRETLVSEMLVREIGVHAGERVLDVAAGTGNTALAAARRGALVTASDLVPANLARAAGRAEVEGLEMSYEVGDVSECLAIVEGAGQLRVGARKKPQPPRTGIGLVDRTRRNRHRVRVTLVDRFTATGRASRPRNTRFSRYVSESEARCRASARM